MPVDLPEPRLWTWRRLAAVTLAKALLAGLLGLAAWGALPALVGWHPTTVSSGSMMPRLHVGDVAVSRPLGSQVPPLGSVLLFDDPDHPGRLRMHRFIRLDDDGLLVTRGDANPADDSTPVAFGAVRGIGTLRVPWVALPVVWLREGQWLDLGMVAAGLALLLVVATSSRDRVFADDDRDDDPAGAPPGDADPDAVEASAVAVVPAEPGAHAGLARTTSNRAPLIVVVPAVRRSAALLGACLLLAGLASPAEAAFRGTTTSRATFVAASYFSCANATAALSPYFWYRMDETSSSTGTATDSSGQSRTGVYSTNGKTTTTNRACRRDTGGAMTFDGSNGYLSSPGVPGGMPNVFSLSIWFKTGTASGGKLIGFGSSQTGSSGSYDRHVYMANSGRIYFGVYPSTVKTVSSTAALNDNVWHLTVATLSSAGMRLYVDGKVVGSDASVTTGEAGTSAYVRVAYDNVSNWTSSPTSNYYSGTLDDAAYYTTALTDAQVSDLYEAGTS